jgi:hypothetical protein
MASGDGEIAEGSHNLGGSAVLDLVTVLVIGAITAIVEAVLDGPMGAQGFGEREFAQGFRRTAGDSKYGLGLDFSVLEIPNAVDPGDLSDVRERQLVGTNGAGEHGAGLDATVALFANAALRGKKPALRRAGRIVREARSGCL